MKYLISLLVIVLIILHHDLWFWNNARLIGGFMPIGLLYHAGLSLAAAIVWFLATKLIWPHELEYEEESADSEPSQQPLMEDKA